MFRTLLTLMSVALLVACSHGQHNNSDESSDTSAFLHEDSEIDSFFIGEAIPELNLPEGQEESFCDFFYTFVNNRRFQTERVNFPITIQSDDCDETKIINNVNAFRKEFGMENLDSYTLLLTNQRQWDVLMNDLSLAAATLQQYDLQRMREHNYTFERTNGRWHLMAIKHQEIEPALQDFLKSYSEFVTDSVFQAQHLASNIRFKSIEGEGEEADVMDGTIDASQWPAFAPEMPLQGLTNIKFSQNYNNITNIHLVRCDYSSSFMETFTFQRNAKGDWIFVAFEN